MQAIRPLAGFDPESRHSFFIPRSLLQPPLALQQMIFPELDRWLTDHFNAASSDRIVEASATARGFLKLLHQLRIVFLQDSVWDREDYPQLRLLWELPVFQSPLYETFATDLRAVVERAQIDDPAQLRLQAVLPDLAAQIDGRTNEVASRVVQLQHYVETQVPTRADVGVIMSAMAQLMSSYNNGLIPRQYVSIPAEMLNAVNQVAAATSSSEPQTGLPMDPEAGDQNPIGRPPAGTSPEQRHLLLAY